MSLYHAGLVKKQDKITVPELIDYLIGLLETQRDLGDPGKAIEGIFNKILKWKRNAGNLDQQ